MAEKTSTTSTATTSGDRISTWESRGHKETFREYQIHCFYQAGSKQQFPNSTESLLIVFLHGYPTNSYDWKETIDQFPQHSALSSHSLLTFDFLGFGLSDKPRAHQYTLSWHADMVEELIARHNSALQQPIFLIGHDMGTSVASELFARDLDGSSKIPNLKGALLFNGNMNMALAKLILGQRVLRSSVGSIFAQFAAREWIFRWQLGSVFSKSYPMTREQGDDQWSLMSYKSGNTIIDKLIQYTFEREKYIERWHGALQKWDKQLFFAWGLEDPVATKEHLTWLKTLRGIERTDISEMPELGHYPQLENPQAYFKMLENVLRKVK